MIDLTDVLLGPTFGDFGPDGKRPPLTAKFFNEDQPRDEHGRFAGGGGSVDTATYPAGRTEGWPKDGVLPVDNVRQVAEGNAWMRGAWEGTVGEDDVVAYRGIGDLDELRDAYETGRWESKGAENIGKEQGTTQFGADPDRIAAWETFGPRELVIEANVAALPFRTIVPPEPLDEDEWPHEQGVRPDIGEGLGIVGGIPTDRITRVGVVEDGKITEWVDPIHLLDKNSPESKRIGMIAEAAAFYSEDQARDELGRFGEGGGSVEYLTRNSDDMNPTVDKADKAVADRAAERAAGFAESFDPMGARANGLVGFEDYGPRLAEAGLLPGANPDDEYDPSGVAWEPHSALAMSEAAAAWQWSYDESAGIQGAADMLLGHAEQPPGDPMAADTITDRRLALADELLTALTDEVPDGAVGPMHTGEGDHEGAIERMTFDSADELVRGMNDDSGEIADMYRQAMAEDRDVAFSLASFMIGGPIGDERRQAFADEYGGDVKTEVYDDETGDYRPVTSFDEALDYTVARTSSDKVVLGETRPPEAAVMVRLEGKTTGLNLDGGFEALTGGRFKVTNIEDTTAPAPKSDAYREIPVTVVTLKQVALPERPK